MFDVHVHELATWSINIIDDSLDTSSNIDVNDIEKVTDYVEDNSVDYLNDLNDDLNELEKDINEKEVPMDNNNESVNDDQPKRHVVDEEIKAPHSSNDVTVKKDIKGVSLIQELNRIVKVGNSLGYDVRGLIDLPIGGHLHTWMNEPGTKLSNFNHFLIFKDVLEALPYIHIIALDRLWSDHNPILLYVNKSDFGPTPFNNYILWLLHDSFDDLIKTKNPLDRDALERHVLLDEIKTAVWECGSNKAHALVSALNGVHGLDHAYIHPELQYRLWFWFVVAMSVHNSIHNLVHNSVHNTPHNSNDEADPNYAVTLISKLDLSHPLHLHPNDSTTLATIFIKLKGTQNYNVWSYGMLLAMEGRNKISFIDNTCRRSHTDEVLGRKWDKVNAVAMETFDRVDGSVTFNLHHKINSLTQNGSPVAEYFNKLSTLWKQFDALVQLPKVKK
ncbi:ribonuclease H-like domain-containing protein [Tanacetum coccineum]